MKVLMVSGLMAVTLIVQIQATGYEAKPYPSYPSPGDSAHSSDKSSEEQTGEPYSFGYHIRDEPSYNLFGQQEEKTDGKKVSGSYYVNLPDGRHQMVNYKDDGYGYVADVKYEDIKYPSAPSYAKYKREVQHNNDAPSYPSRTLYYPTTPSYRSAPTYPTYKGGATYNQDAPSYPKND
ncbi:uncharacterized protein LOC123476785 [Daphnia magna]|uniref:uncharacterized protein LOC116931569 n=1 Tax=Daphnia magna TaxID=35525 RepID=UPI001E1BCC8B|nr:uncharacterized protein LOC116931569 [Daphnia magna]XP_045035415.1 uncharacterized protein LOC123476785 [Daphnia magna]